MRVSTSQFVQQGLRALQDQSALAYEYQRQISEGTRAGLASEAPDLASAAVRVTLYEAQFAMYKSNQQSIDHNLTLAENQLNSVHESLLQIRTWATQARNDTNGADKRQILGAQIGQLRASIAQFSKATDAYGLAVFRTTAIPSVDVASGIGMPTAVAYADVMGRTAPDGIGVTGQVDILDALSQLEQTLKAGTAPTDAQMDTLAQGLQQVNLALAQTGALHKRLEQATQLADDQALAAKKLKSDLLDADPVEAASKLAQTNTLLKALQTLLGSLGSNSLFDKL